MTDTNILSFLDGGLSTACAHKSDMHIGCWLGTLINLALLREEFYSYG